MFEGQPPVELDVETDTAIRILDACERARLGKIVACDRRVVRGPTITLSFAADVADEIETPVGARRIIGEVAKGNGHLGDPSVGDHTRAHQPDGVPPW